MQVKTELSDGKGTTKDYHKISKRNKKTK